MGIKLIALDLDDTLLNDERHISPRNQAAIFEAVRRGVKVTVSTGRMYKSALPFAKELKIDVPLIVYNGAMIKTNISQEILFHQTIEISAAKEIFALAKKNNWYVQAYINDNLYVSRLDSFARRYSDIIKVEITKAGEDLFEMYEEPLTKIMIQDEAAKLQEILAELKEIFSDRLSLTISKPNYLEITNSGVNKGAALAMLAARFEIEREFIMAIGDSGNDIDMLKFANWSVAMENSTPEAKKAARFQTGTNNADGVAQAIEKYVLGSNGE